jgi:probable F420-dependent oxidoreductase
MSLAAVFPTTEIGPDAGAVRAWAEAVEEMGFDRIIAYDHVLGATHADREPPLRGPYTEHDPFHEPLVLFGYLAAVTRRVELMTGVLILPQRPVALVAKQAVEIDLLSGGRLVLGVGTGWNHVEYEALGATFRNRAKRFDEQVQVLQLLWDEALVDFTGQYHRIDRAGLVPRAGRPLPLWFGGSSEAALRRAVRWGKGFTFGTAGARIEAAFGVLQGLLADAGRDPATLPTEAILHAAKGTDTVVEEAAGWRALGNDGLAISTMTNVALGADKRRCDGLDAHLAVLAEVRDAIAG